jgi:hypothetical protein
MADLKRTSEEAWAKPAARLQVEGDIPRGAMNLNVQGRQLNNPLQGFGQMWQKTYRMKLIAPRVPMTGQAAAPQDIISAWRANFARFWPPGNKFYAPLTEIKPGEVAVLNLQGPGGMPLSTGVRVIYADDEQFSFMTPEGHMFAGMVTFSSFEEDDAVYAQVQALIRPNDPLYETSFRMGFGHKAEDAFWRATLENLSQYFGASGVYELKAVVVDPRVQWSKAKNIWQNAAIRSGMYTMTAPVRWLGRRLGGKK